MRDVGKVRKAFEDWYSSLQLYSDFPARGTIAGALVILERLRTTNDLSIDAHTAKGGSQVAGVSGEAVTSILSRFGETRPFAAMGGRTNRGLRGDIITLLAALRAAGFNELPAAQRIRTLDVLQEHLVQKVREWHQRQRLEIAFDPTQTTRELVRQILAKADAKRISGPVAQYLVGAKLQMRFPDANVDNSSFSTADQQLGRSGDFVIGATAFHVTIAPMGLVYDRCKQNLNQGLRSYLLVPERILVAVRANADSVAPGRISVESIESFVGGNVDELSHFSQSQLADQCRALLKIYNDRVDVAEIDKSMLIEIPSGL